jgi:glycosyltransferase involved in cell wall biosynthesis
MTLLPRIAWLSPYGPRSDIGAFTRCVLPHFATNESLRADCDLFINSCGRSYDSPTPSMELPPAGSLAELLAHYDATVLNLGNNVENHGDIVSVLRRVPGIAILHDFSYHHFFAFKCFEELHSPPAYARLMHDYCGSAGFSMALRSGVITRGATLYAPWDGENVADYPLMQPLASLAGALVVHSRFMEEHVSRFFKGPILRLFLPSDQKVAPSDDDIARWRLETAGRARCQFATFGHLSRAKCLDTLIQAFAQSPALRSRANLIIAGHPGDWDYVHEIEAMVTKHGLTKQVAFEYDITNERLLQIKGETDIFLNLRYPNTEGASGSLTEMMNAGKPVIAYASGAYAEVPSDSAVLLDRADGLEAVIEAMEGLIADPDRRIAIGDAALNHVRPQNSERYARELRSFIVDHGDLLRRRNRLVAPVRDGYSWKAGDVAQEDSAWFDELTRARRAFLLLERDRWVLSPEIFLTWPAGDLVAMVARVFVHSSLPGELSAVIADCLNTLGRWKFYLLVSKLRFYQSLFEKPGISKEALTEHADRVGDVEFWRVAMRLQPGVAVRLLYLCVLERGCDSSESDYWVRRVGEGFSIYSVLLDFLASQEYRRSFADQLMAEVESWAREEVTSASDAPQQKPQVVWPVGESVRFSEDDPPRQALLGTNWYRREPQGRWSSGRTADMRFLLPETLDGLGATLTLRLRVAGTKITGRRRVVAHCNRGEVAAITFEDDGPQNWSIPLPRMAHSKNGINLLLVCDQDYSPAMAGESNDKRSLGILLMEGRLTAETPARSDDQSMDVDEIDIDIEEVQEE